MLCKAKKNFKFSTDGTTITEAKAGEEYDIPDHLVRGLAAADCITDIRNDGGDKDAGASLENKDAGAAPENKVEIPDDWRELAWPELRSLAASISPTPVSTRDDCIAAIEMELDARG